MIMTWLLLKLLVANNLSSARKHFFFFFFFNLIILHLCSFVYIIRELLECGLKILSSFYLGNEMCTCMLSLSSLSVYSPS
jgi:hypothetical protein